MPKGGLEPPCPFEHNALNVACLPISPLRRVCCGQGLYYCITCGLSSAFAPFSCVKIKMLRPVTSRNILSLLPKTMLILTVPTCYNKSVSSLADIDISLCVRGSVENTHGSCLFL